MYHPEFGLWCKHKKGYMPKKESSYEDTHVLYNLFKFRFSFLFVYRVVFWRDCCAKRDIWGNIPRKRIPLRHYVRWLEYLGPISERRNRSKSWTRCYWRVNFDNAKQL